MIMSCFLHIDRRMTNLQLQPIHKIKGHAQEWPLTKLKSKKPFYYLPIVFCVSENRHGLTPFLVSNYKGDIGMRSRAYL